MKFTSSNDDHSSNKVEPQLDTDQVASETTTEVPHSEKNESSYQQENTSNFKEKTMNSDTHNPVLQFVKNVGETAQYVWDHYFDWVIHVSWGKMFLTCLLVLIGGSILCLHSIANWFVFGSLLLKCFVGKEDQVSKAKETENIHTEGN
jgi:hypothetical protein